MINKKVFALTLVASSVIAAGCSSDDDDDPDEPAFDQTTDAVLTDAQSRDVTGDGILTDADDFNGDGTINEEDITAFAAVVISDDSTDVNGDGNIDANDDFDRDGDVDDDDVTGFGMGGGTTDPVDPMEPTMATLPAAEDYDPSTLEPVPTLNLAELATAAGLTQLVSNVGGCEFAGALSDPEARLTVFAPTDEAFGEQAVADALAAGADVCDVIAGHVLADTVANSVDLTGNVGNVATTLAGTTVEITQDDDGNLLVGGAPVITPDNYATNGVAHVISSVILPMADEEEDMEGEEGMEGEETGNGSDNGAAVDAANAAGNSEFAQLWNTSGLGQSLENNQWTVFAPTNEAIDDGVFQTLNASQESAFNVLNGHIVTTGSIDSDELSGLSTITVNTGTEYPVTVDGDTITVGGFTVTPIESDSDSTVYSIDGVLQ